MERLQDFEDGDDNKVRGNSWGTRDDEPFHSVWRPTHEITGSKLGHDEANPRRNGGERRHDEHNMAGRVTENEDHGSFGGKIRYEHMTEEKVTENEDQGRFSGEGSYEHRSENDDAINIGGKLRYEMAPTSINSKTSLARTLRKMGVSRCMGVGVRGWKVWVMAGAIYCCLTLFLQQPSPFALTPEEEAESLKEWAKEVGNEVLIILNLVLQNVY